MLTCQWVFRTAAISAYSQSMTNIYVINVPLIISVNRSNIRISQTLLSICIDVNEIGRLRLKLSVITNRNNEYLQSKSYRKAYSLLAVVIVSKIYTKNFWILFTECALIVATKVDSSSVFSQFTSLSQETKNLQQSTSAWKHKSTYLPVDIFAFIVLTSWLVGS